MDYLRTMFDKQAELQARLKVNDFIMNEADRQQYINLMVLALHDEVAEIQRATAWKNPAMVPFGWKKTQAMDVDLFKEEIIDAFHFIMNLSLAVGMGPEEFFAIYCKKNGINFERQERGY